MIENILYEIDNAFNESESNVADAIIESCTKALEILENSSDDMDLSSFGVYQEAATAVKEPPKKTDTKKDDKKIEQIVTIDPRVAKAASEMKKNKEETKKNLSKQRDNALNTKMDSYYKDISKMKSNMMSKQYKDMKIFVMSLPENIRILAKAFKTCKAGSNKSSTKTITESTNIISSANEQINSKSGSTEDTDINIDAVFESIKQTIYIKRKKISESEAERVAAYFSVKYKMSQEDLNKISEKLIKEENDLKKSFENIGYLTRQELKAYKKKIESFDNTISTLTHYSDNVKKFFQLVNDAVTKYTPSAIEALDRTDNQLENFGAGLYFAITEGVVNALHDIYQYRDKYFKDIKPEEIKERTHQFVTDTYGLIKNIVGRIEGVGSKAVSEFVKFIIKLLLMIFMGATIFGPGVSLGAGVGATVGSAFGYAKVGTVAGSIGGYIVTGKAFNKIINFIVDLALKTKRSNTEGDK